MKKTITSVFLIVGLTFGLASVSEAKFNLGASELQSQSSAQTINGDAVVAKKWGWWWW